MLLPTSIVDMGHLVDQFIEYWLENLPDMSDFPDIPPSMVQFWKKKRKGEKVNKHRRKREHVTLKGQLGLGRHAYFFIPFCLPTCPKFMSTCIFYECIIGCCGKWANEALDFAISRNKWPVRFQNVDGNMVDLVPEFICCMWLGYVAKMRGHPAPSAKSAQTVLKYLLINDSDVVKAWRNRIYRYSSGTLFAKTTVELQDYLHDLNDPSALRKVIYYLLLCLPT